MRVDWNTYLIICDEKKLLRQAVARLQTKIHSDICGIKCCEECDYIDDVLDNLVTPDATQAADDKAGK